MNLSFLTPLFLIVLVVAYYLTDLEIIKIIPALISTLFFLLFLFAYLYDKKMILKFTKKFYKKELNHKEIEYISHGDGYWAIVTFINSMIQAVLAFYGDSVFWALYISVGWYLYFLLALILQVAYGKVYAIKRQDNKREG
jgi:uncharacterized membrane protein